jgi:hypothetical protein
MRLCLINTLLCDVELCAALSICMIYLVVLEHFFFVYLYNVRNLRMNM